MIRKLAVLCFFTLSSSLGWSQESVSDFDQIEKEVNAVQGKVEAPPPPEVSPVEPPVSSSHSGSIVDEEIREQNQMLQKKQEKEITSEHKVDRFPKEQPLFTKPPGPKQGGSIRVEHPNAGKGLIRINKDGSYQYRTALKSKSQSGSFKINQMTPPQVKAAENSAITYESMYGDSNLFLLEFDYTWQPFTKFGALGLKVGTGFATASGKGNFKNTDRPDEATQSEESYNLFIVPMSAFLEYRFEYVRRQWVVPYVFGGGTYYGLAEVRNDGQAPNFAGAPAAGGGGGLLISISRWDPAGAFTMSSEYGIADMWLAIEAKAMQGLSEDTDFTNQSVGAGIAVDF